MFHRRLVRGLFVKKLDEKLDEELDGELDGDLSEPRLLA